MAQCDRTLREQEALRRKEVCARLMCGNGDKEEMTVKINPYHSDIQLRAPYFSECS